MSYRIEMFQNGSMVRKIVHNGKYYLPVNYGEFTVRVYNDTARKIVAVISVDGLSVMDGKSATFNSGGYVIDPYCSCDVQGWRRGNNEVAKFEITEKSQSYAEKTGRGSNVGVIGVVVYPEKIKIKHSEYKNPLLAPYPWPHQEPYCSNSVNIMTSYTMGCSNEIKTCSLTGQHTNSTNITRRMSSQVGTGYGRKTEDHVTTVEFERSEYEKQVITLYYDTPENLRNRGIPVDGYDLPIAFPGEGNFCPEPPR